MTELPPPAPRRGRRWRQLNWPNILWWAAIHAAVVLAPFTFCWSALAVCLILYVAAGFGVTMGYHRLLTHRSFQTPRVVAELSVRIRAASLALHDAAKDADAARSRADFGNRWLLADDFLASFQHLRMRGGAHMVAVQRLG